YLGGERRPVDLVQLAGIEHHVGVAGRWSAHRDVDRRAGELFIVLGEVGELVFWDDRLKSVRGRVAPLAAHRDRRVDTAEVLGPGVVADDRVDEDDVACALERAGQLDVLAEAGHALATPGPED